MHTSLRFADDAAGRAGRARCYTDARCASYRIDGGILVSLYVMLSTLSESGRKVLRERPGWIRKVNADVERMGARVVAQYAVLGPYDFVTVIDAADNATISRISVELGARGSVQMMTMAAIPLDEFIGRLERTGAKTSQRKKRS
jgi:uncharacterized protein with GYD domain